MPIKMYCIFSRESLEAMTIDGQVVKGKLAAQAGHAYLHAWWDAVELVQYLGQAADSGCKEDYDEYQRFASVLNEYQTGDDARKIGLVVDTTEELRQLVEDYRGFTGTTLVEDCGYTIVEPGTITCAGIGPLRDSEKGDDLKDLELLV